MFALSGSRWSCGNCFALFLFMFSVLFLVSFFLLSLMVFVGADAPYWTSVVGSRKVDARRGLYAYQWCSSDTSGSCNPPAVLPPFPLSFSPPSSFGCCEHVGTPIASRARICRQRGYIRRLELRHACCFALRENVLYDPATDQPGGAGGPAGADAAAAAVATMPSPVATPARHWTLHERLALWYVFGHTTAAAGLAADEVHASPPPPSPCTNWNDDNRPPTHPTCL